MFHVKINEINERCRRDPAAFIEESERSYTNVIESIADCICENRYDRTILLLNGPSSSGKTTTSHRIRDAIERRGICSVCPPCHTSASVRMPSRCKITT